MKEYLHKLEKASPPYVDILRMECNNYVHVYVYFILCMHKSI